MPYTIIRGNFWENQDALSVVSSHGTLTSAGGLEMGGSGSLGKLAALYPGIDLALGKAIQSEGFYQQNYGFKFGFIAVEIPGTNRFFGLVQTKLHWNDKPDHSLLAMGLMMLNDFAHELSDADYGGRLNVSMVYPGIGHGQLTPQRVEPLLRSLLVYKDALHRVDYTVYTKALV